MKLVSASTFLTLTLFFGTLPLWGVEDNWDQELILRTANRAAKWMIDHPKRHHPLDWTYGAFYQGVAALAMADPGGEYPEVLRRLGRRFKWGHLSRIYHADDHCIGQTWLEMAIHDGNLNYAGKIRENYDFLIAHPNRSPLDFKTNRCKRWSWCDALFMSPTVLVRLGGLTGDLKYWRFMDREYRATYDYLYSKKEHLFFRDSTYFKSKCRNGKPVFWSRGEGWVFGGLAIIIRDLPDDWPTRNFYINLFKEMAGALKAAQHEDGSWHPSLLDPSSPDRQEMSGTSFFTYGMLWGLNNGILDRETYLPVAKKGWSAICRNINGEGRLGFVQPIAGNPQDGNYYNQNTTEVYAVGAYLCAAMELRKMIVEETHPDRLIVTAENPITVFRPSETLEIPWPQAGLKAEDLRVFDFRNSAVLPHQLYDSDSDGKPDTLLFRSPFLAGQKRVFWLFNGKDLPAASTAIRCKSRYVPERLDDFAWENDKVMNRVYGPAVSRPRPQGEGLLSSGVDVWVKNTPDLMFDKWYKRGNYHHNYGQGMDGYKTANGCGCGGFGAVLDGQWSSAINWQAQKHLCDGPVRTAFTLSYAEWPCGKNATLREERKMILDAGSPFTRYESTFTLKGVESIQGGPGLDLSEKRHHNGEIAMSLDRGWVANYEPPQGNNGSLATAILLPGGGQIATDPLQGVHLTREIRSAGKMVWYAGSAWSHAGFYTCAEDWHKAVKDFSESLNHPLKISIK